MDPLALILIVATLCVQSVAFHLGKLLHGIPGRVLDVLMILLAVLYMAPTLLLTKGDFVPLNAWSLAWLAAYFVGNIEQKRYRTWAFWGWFVISSFALVYLMPEH